jgi:acyl-CoA reductase-like NAD-dependent aldehyde dehydrogenase
MYEKSATALEVANPADGSTLATLEAHGAEQVAAAVARLRAAQPEWEALGPEGRYRWLGALRDWVSENHEELTDLLQAETGKVRGDATLEPTIVCDLINFYGKRSKQWLADEEVRPHLLITKRLRVVHRPHPVVGVIGPWNFPIILAVGDAIPALCAGCAVVVKPSEFTPLTALRIAKAWKEEIGGPDVFEVVVGAGETGSAVVDEVDYVMFTGSEATGKKVMARAAETLTPLSLELGGKDPLIVLRDADIDRAANGTAFGGLMNSGQICLSVERVYVEEPVYDEFVAKLKRRVEGLRQGFDGRSYTSDVGAMTSPNQIGIVEDHIEDAVSKGATVLTGGKRREGPGDYFEPTVVTDVDHSMKLMRDETFGPVMGVMKVRDADEAVRLANDSRYGLAANVFGSTEQAEAVARRLEVGTVNVNDVLINYAIPDVPMGGWKNSGIGYRSGKGGLLKYCRQESLVITRWPGAKAEPLWYPYTPRKRRAIRALSRFLNARGLRRRLGLRRR